MFVFYVLPIALAISCSISFVSTVLFAILTRKKHYQSLIPLLLVLQLSFIIPVILIYTLGYDLQVAIALPYIQEALDEQCAENPIEAEAEGFYIEDVFRWKADDGSVACGYFGGWVCDCPP